MKKRISFFALVLIGTATFIACGGPVGANNKEATQLSQDSVALLTDLNKEMKVGELVLEVIPTEITEFNNRTCRLRFMLPADRNGRGTESLGVEKCSQAAKWLHENGYDLGMNGIYVTCHVYSDAGHGTTGKSLVTKWGVARYDFNNDTVKWEPAE
ncbi:MAG: hypothetical protein J1E79_04030 [Rikenella sp.]|nr:hypothetical protein [Rikenella sp.]